MISIVITHEAEIDAEDKKITSLLDSGVDYIHIRKPEYGEKDVARLISRIPERLHPRLTLHDHFNLTNLFKIGGIHLNNRNSIRPLELRDLRISRSCHTLEETENIEDYAYVTLSPIFDSISKKGYESKFNIDDLKIVGTNRRIIALGGLTPDKAGPLINKGFYGIALLGYVWEGNFDSRLNTLKKIILENRKKP